MVRIWKKCFFGYVNKTGRRICAFDERPIHCSDNCSYFITNRKANAICKNYVINRKEIEYGYGIN